MLKKSDPTVVYMGPEKGPFKCSRCEYFIQGGRCEKVSGNIDPDGCCNLFDPEEKHELKRERK